MPPPCPPAVTSRPRRASDANALGNRSGIADVLEHDIDALASGDPHRLDGQILGAVVHARVGAEIEPDLHPIVAAGRGDDLGAEILRNLHAGAAEPAGGAHHQHPFAGLHLGVVLQQVERGRRVARDHRGGREIDAVGDDRWCCPQSRGRIRHSRPRRARRAGGSYRRCCCRRRRCASATVTRSPTLRLVTPGPSLTITPDGSTPGTSGSVTGRAYLPARTLVSSVRFTETAWTLISTSPGPGSGVGTSSSFITPGGPNSRITIAFNATSRHSRRG